LSDNNSLYTGNTVNIGGVRVKGTTLFDDNSTIPINVEYKYVLDNGTTSGWGYDPPVYQENKTITVFNCSNNNINSPIYSLGQTAISSIQTTIDRAGVAHIGFSPATFIISIVVQPIISYLVGLFSSDHQDFTNTTIYSDPINFNNPLPFEYSRIEIKNSSNNIQSGIDIYEYTSPFDYPLENQELSAPYSNKQRYHYWKYGLPKKIINKDANGNPVKMVEYKYDPIPYGIEMSDVNAYLSRKWTVKSIYTTCQRFFNDGGATDKISSETYKPFVGKIDLLETKEYLYNNSGNFNLNTTSYEYNDFFLLKKKTLTNSKGEAIETLYKYANDYTIEGPLTTLKGDDINNISAPVLTETYIYKSGVKKLLSGSIIEYGTLKNGNIQPVRTYSLRTDRPVNDNSLAAFSSSQLVRDPAFYKQTSELIYNQDGNLVETNKLIDVDGTAYTSEITSVIVDKENPQLVIATTTNTSYTDIAYTSFETPVDVSKSNTNWTYNESLVSSENSLTGTLSFKFDNIIRAISRRRLNRNIRYKISFWSQDIKKPEDPRIVFRPGVNIDDQKDANGNLIVNNGPLKQYTIPHSTWSLYECYVSGASTVNIINLDNNSPNPIPFTIDEVRLYPDGSSMSTSTYNIQGLKTSEDDANDRIQYIEYDGLGRPRLIRDEEGNIRKTYEYNFKQ